MVVDSFDNVTFVSTGEGLCDQCCLDFVVYCQVADAFWFLAFGRLRLLWFGLLVILVMVLLLALIFMTMLVHFFSIINYIVYFYSVYQSGGRCL